ncbi:MAG TPA: serine protease [Acidimicrobiales bacterium]|jgi:S1-C subfamily serine protease|nr:trypsin-like peptidase domain-containing protein [Actinomycetes bacterium]MDP6241157.1 serine protease [Acidimicrobiales bacterium]MDP7125165.1 serine protease [Acidimicrobiales bacterium]MDP7352632.1 serine protease [Acidimicrobiales bacterium]HJL76813.1 serine protease [Acidimicrobiales bacterium]|tara:strand:- start:2830 stop:4380 length:1551 start_codon:yes stop_codon:yes gene_type:complete
MRSPFLLLTTAALLVGCTAGDDSADSDLLLEQAAVVESLQEQVADLEARVARSTSTVPPTTAPPTTTSSTTTVPAPMPTAAEVFAAASPSVVFIEVPSGTGSGLVLSDGWVATNAHVVGRYPTVRLFTSVGEFVDIPVHARDWLNDLALVGPLTGPVAETLPALDFGSAETVRVGEAVYLVGFPGEVESDPEATITAGILSRRRRHPCLDVTFLQVDALIAGGQSGGALLDERGNLIGISGLGGFTDSNFGLVFSAEDVVRVLQPMYLPGSGSTEAPGRKRQEAASAYYDTAAFLVTVTEALPTLSVRASAPSGADIWLVIDSADGFPPIPAYADDELDYLFGGTYGEEDPDAFYADENAEGDGETLEVRVLPGRYVVSVGYWSPAEWESLEVTSSHPLVPLDDPENGSDTLRAGSSATGNIGHLYDTDRFHIELEADEQVRIQVDSLGDPVMSLYLDDFLIASNDDAGTGLYGAGASMVVVAPATGTYDLDLGMIGEVPVGYGVTVQAGEDEACR